MAAPSRQHPPSLPAPRVFLALTHWSTTTLPDTITLDPTKYDQEQINLMEERLILLDNDDHNIGEGSKKDCESPRVSLPTALQRARAQTDASPTTRPPPPTHRPPHPSLWLVRDALAAAPRLLRLPVPPRDGQTLAPAPRRRKDHVPGHVDKHVLLAPAHVVRRDGRGRPDWCATRPSLHPSQCLSGR